MAPFTALSILRSPAAALAHGSLAAALPKHLIKNGKTRIKLQLKALVIKGLADTDQTRYTIATHARKPRIAGLAQLVERLICNQ